MDLWQSLFLLVAGVVAGALNAMVGSGSLVTFPTLLALGYPPVAANVTNKIGIVPGAISGALAYRRELRAHTGLLVKLMPASLVGGFLGALILFALPASTFEAVVPGLILFACALVLVQPAVRRLTGWSSSALDRGRSRLAALIALAFVAGIYGGYFGAAQGVVLIAVLTLLFDGSMQTSNAVKNALAATANTAAAVVFIVAGGISWLPVVILAVGSSVGGQIGGRLGKRLPPLVYRIVIVCVGLAAVAKLLAD
ncbi:MAG TPA: sulfite exporter TauE/SafE family protein [Nocardioidaceae bacterium]|nr:sulfite exporter TauE/SafE family protein [Nocardioidaceae bacterium]